MSMFMGRPVFFILICGFLCQKSVAQLSPGPLSKPHSQLEGIRNCGKCHGVHKMARVDEAGCNSCHTLIGGQIRKRAGLHGRNKYTDCGRCHPEHVSKTFKILNWRVEGGIKNFNHLIKTGYKLEGAHRKQKCRDCHRETFIKDHKVLTSNAELNLKTTYLGLSRECLDCHEDEHGKGYAKKCTECHAMKGWRPAPLFNHDTMTGYKLKGKHRRLKCDDCHTKETPWKLPAGQRISGKSCLDCHEDGHKGKYGKRCASCHTESGWRKIKKAGFNHDKTDYPLTGKHRGLRCVSCHPRKGSWKVSNFKQCGDCHKDGHPKQIKYPGRYRGCEDCHTTKGFSPSEYTIADHGKTEFKLEGAHLASACIECHKPLRRLRNKSKEICKRQFRFLMTGCSECHANPHGKGINRELKESGCEYCHIAAGWDSISFDHDNCGWPLEGRHNGLDCAACHKPTRSKYTRKKPWLPRFRTIKNLCADCHQDIHQGQFELNKKTVLDSNGRPDPFNSGCAGCHTSTDWMAEKFDHNRDSRYKLEGAHLSVTCDKCHPKEKIKNFPSVRYRPLKRDCRDCHAETGEMPDLKRRIGL